MTTYILNAEKRNIFGKKVKTEREKGFMPAVLYGRDTENQPIFVSLKEFQKLYKEAGETSVIEVLIDSVKKNAMIYDISFDPINGVPVHADFLMIKMDEPIEATVPLVFHGNPEAVKLGGILVKVVHELNVKALPNDIPHELAVDLSKLKTLEDKITVSDIKILRNVEILLKDPDEVIALIEIPKEEVKDTSAEINFESIEATKEKKEEEEEQK